MVSKYKYFRNNWVLDFWDTYGVTWVREDANTLRITLYRGFHAIDTFEYQWARRYCPVSWLEYPRKVFITIGSLTLVYNKQTHRLKVIG